MNKEFFISDLDLEIFKEWIKQPENVQKILENHSKVKDACDAIDRRMNNITHELLTTPFIPML